jgi:hypothetical protein
MLTAADYSAIRAALDPEMTAEDLPDAIIEEPIYAAAAELELLARVPTASTLTGAALTHIRNAVILLTAARIAPAMISITQQTLGAYGYSASPIDWFKRAAELRARAEQEIGLALGESAPGVRPFTLFGVAQGRRGL